MENPTPFDLNEAIQRWQQKFSASPAFAATNLEELATHLRASVFTLKTKGLSEEEAFIIAARRLGEPSTLEQEFAKVNADSVWLTRGIWMLAGIVGLQIVETLASIVSLAVSLLLHLAFAPQLPLSEGAMRTIIGWGATGYLILLAFRWLKSKPQPVAAWMRRRLGSPWQAILGLILLVVGLVVLNLTTILAFNHYVGITQLGISVASWNSFFTWPLKVILPPLLLGLLARRRLGMNRTIAGAR